MTPNKLKEFNLIKWLSPIKDHPVRSIALFLTYMVLAQTSVSITLPDSPISPVWLPSGFALAIVYIYKESVLPVLFMAALASAASDFLFSNNNVLSTVALVASFGLLNTLQPYLIYRFFINVTGADYPFDRDRSLLAFYLGAILVIVFTSSIFAMLSSITQPDSGININYTLRLLVFTLADFLGILFLTPLILAHHQFRGFRYISDKLLEWSAWFVGLGIVSYLSFYQGIQSVFLVLPLTIWAATRFSQAGCAAAVSITLSLAFLALIYIDPINSTPNNLYDLIILEILLAIIITTTLYVSALLEERQKVASKLEDIVLQRTEQLQKTNQELSDEVYIRKQAEKSFRRSSRRYKALIETAGSPIIVIDDRYLIKQWNSAAESLFGYSRDDVIGKNYIDCFVPQQQQDETAWKITKVIESGVGKENLNSEAIAFDGVEHAMLWNINRISNSDDEPTQVILIGQDITEIQTTQDQLHHLAHFDILTGAANRRLFEDRCNQALKQSLRHQHSIAIITLDIDFFKRINDTFGHDAGDELLKVIVNRLTACVRNEDTVARLGGDEFSVLLADVSGVEGAELVARNILDAITTPIPLPSGELVITSSIGVSLAPDDAAVYAELLKNADMAMYQAKSSGRNNIQFFDPKMNEDMLQQLSIEQELRHAITNNELKLYYQPIIDIESGQIIALETLLRWQHPTKGLLSPDKFLKVAEQTGQLLAIGEWTLQNACLQGKAVQAMSKTPVKITLNVSNRQYSHPQLVKTIARVLMETRFNPRFLVLEIEENTITNKLEESVITLNKLKELGLTLTIDSFGSGISSLSHLKKLPIDIIKIDRTFIKGIPSDENDMIITETLINIAHQMNLRTFAAGIETREQEAFLKINGCQYVQGYLYSNPLPSELLPQLFQEIRNGLRLNEGSQSFSL
ncbi:bifunctional diguanylate cyclase/phosphodiesterase [Alkalimarinus alittae]|uniref:EAL domain-containing protein n=1 Tax=Alkalimarinus alittae TaxID=2961619 RepID=A0ABY6MYY3_9ALTE|nr:EAL domain-containing protein [Alkalimarinus alittae]UZE94997.1 EAL domain-containing protein [Alkalimarinus alittae]